MLISFVSYLLLSKWLCKIMLIWGKNALKCTKNTEKILYPRKLCTKTIRKSHMRRKTNEVLQADLELGQDKNADGNFEKQCKPKWHHCCSPFSVYHSLFLFGWHIYCISVPPMLSSHQLPPWHWRWWQQRAKITQRNTWRYLIWSQTTHPESPVLFTLTDNCCPKSEAKRELSHQLLLEPMQLRYE